MSLAAAASLDALPTDVVRSHVLSRLDGPALVAASCASSQLHCLSSDDALWRSVSQSTWPSVEDPLVARVVSAFPSGYRSFFSDAYPVLDHSGGPPPSSDPAPPQPSSLISAVDVFYRDKPILSRAQETETTSGWFVSSPFRVDLLGEKELVPTPIASDGWQGEMEEDLTLSWILVDPATGRAVNVSSGRPVSVQRHWLTGEVQARYVTAVRGGRGGSRVGEYVYVTAEVRLWPTEGGKGRPAAEVREVSLRAEDAEGRCLTGRESAGAIAGAVGSGAGRRRKGRGREEGRRRYEEYEVMRRECRERRVRMERALDFAFVSLAVASFLAVWSFLLFQ